MIKQYTNEEITVVWKPALCIHSKLCWKGLSEVFNPQEKPWIKMSQASTASIIAQVEKCPSAALSYYRNDKTNIDKDEEIITENVIEIRNNGPLMVYGNITVKHKDGTAETRHKVTAFCRCGASTNKPFCDGSHLKVGFKDE